MNLSNIMPLVAIHLYALGTVSLLAGILARRDFLKKLALGLTLIAFIAHTLLICDALLNNSVVALTRAMFVMVLAWGLTFLGLILWNWWGKRYNSLLLVISPLALLLFLTALLLRHTDVPLPPILHGMVFSIHIIATFCSICLIIVAFGAGVLFLLQEKTIKSKIKIVGFQQDLPALSTLDRVNAVSTNIGFPLLTIGLLFGFIAARLMWGTILSGDPKEVVSLIVWGFYAFLFQRRMICGWRGGKPAFCAIGIFALWAFSFVAVTLLMPSHHSFALIAN